MGLDLNPLSPLIKFGEVLIDKLIPDPQAKAKAHIDLLTLQQTGQLAEMDRDLKLALAQTETNKIEAASESLFKSGWRPAVGWTCAGGLFYQMIARPLLGWIAVNWFGWQVPPPPLEMDTLMTLLFGMLGLGAFRMTEKIKGVA